MKFIFTLASLSKEGGGPTYSVPALARAVCRLGAEVSIHTLSSDLSQENVGVELRVNKSRASLLCDVDHIVDANPGSVVIYDNGLWLPFNFSVCKYAYTKGIPYAIAPRGMLEPWCMQHKWLKKKAAWHLYQRRYLDRASLIHATGKLEADNIRHLGIETDIVVSPNGVDVLEQKPTSKTGGHTLLFLSRIHLKKGIEILLDAWAHLDTGDWRLCIAGSGDANYIKTLRERAHRLGISDQVQWMGHLDAEGKQSAFAQADLFVLPTFSENFGIVVAEALAAGVPVITTTETPWAGIGEHDCGILIKPDVSEIKSALTKCMQLSDNERLKMGERGRSWMKADYSWDSAARVLFSSMQKLL